MYHKYVLELENQGQLHDHLRVLNYRYSRLHTVKEKRPAPNGTILASEGLKRKNVIELHLRPQLELIAKQLELIANYRPGKRDD